MKQRKERDFVKRICEELNFEVIVSRIEILETHIKDNELIGVTFKDRFGTKYLVYYNKYNEPQYRKIL